MTLIYKGITEVTLESLQSDFLACAQESDRSIVLSLVLEKYSAFIKKESIRYHNIFPHILSEDFKQVIHIGIWKGLEEMHKDIPIAINIYYSIRHELSKSVQQFFSKKAQTVWNESLGFEEKIADPMDYISRKTMEIDIWSAIKKLPKKIVRSTISLYYLGYSVNEISEKYGICKMQIYNYINYGKRILKDELSEYRYG